MLEKSSYRLIPPTLVSLTFLFALLLYSGKSQLMLSDTDFWWHLKAGEIINTSGLPKFDPFSFSNAGYSWLNLSWLWDSFYYWLYSISGLYLPLIVTMLTNAFTLSLLVWFMLKRGVPIIAIMMTMFLCIGPYSYMMTPRPHQITFLMTILFYVITHMALSGKNIKSLFILPLLMVVWVNMHGGFMVGFIILGAYGVDSLFKRNWKEVKYIAYTILACIFSIFINPLGLGIIDAFLKPFTGIMMPYISEWSPIEFKASFIIHLTYFILFLVSFNPFSNKVRLAEKIQSLFWVFLAFKHERNIPLGILLSAPVMAWQIERLFKYLPIKFQAQLVAKNTDYENNMQHPYARSMMFALALIFSASLLAGAGKIWMHLSPSQQYHPVEETEYLRMNYNNLVILNDYFQGGYIMYGLKDTSKIFIDGRAETAYPNDVLNEYIAMLHCSAGWEGVIPKYSINAAIIPKTNTCVTSYFDENNLWSKVFSGKLDNVYIKKTKDYSP